jgi:hypothetical protein
MPWWSYPYFTLVREKVLSLVLVLKFQAQYVGKLWCEGDTLLTFLHIVNVHKGIQKLFYLYYCWIYRKIQNIYSNMCVYLSCWPRGTLYPQKLALTSPISDGCSVVIVRPRTQATEFVCFFVLCFDKSTHTFFVCTLEMYNSNKVIHFLRVNLLLLSFSTCNLLS